MSQRLFLPLFAAGAALALLAASLSVTTTRDVEAQEEVAIEQTVAAAVNAWNSQDVINFLLRFTDQGFEAEFGFSKSDLQGVAAMIGDPPIVEYTVENVVVTDGTATAAVHLNFAPGFSESNEWSFVLSGTEWKVDGSTPIAPEIPEGATVVDVQLDEYEFIYDQAAVEAGGDIAFSIENIGEEDHEFVLLHLTTDAPLSELLESEEEEPEGIEFLTFAMAGPGESTAAVLPGPLEDGRYGLVCFLPAPDGTPHAFLGMVSEFNVGDSTGEGAAPIAPPNTGNGGLADVSGAPSPALLAVSAIFMLIALTSLVPVIRR
jgi:hypothetical protein